MGTAVGRQLNVGTGVESTYGTPVAPDRWHEVTGETLDFRPNNMNSNGLRGGTNTFGRRASRRQRSTQDGGGGIAMEVPTTTFGRWLAHTLGGTPTIAQQGATTAYLHTYAQGSLNGKSLTIQKQFRDAANTEVESYTFHGSKILSAAFAVAPNQYLTADFTIDAEDVDTTTATASASYSEVDLFTWKHGAITVDGSPVAKVTNAAWTISNAMKTDGYYLGGSGLKSEPTDNDYRSVTGTLDVEFADPATVWTKFFNDTEFELVLTFAADNIEGAYDYTLEFTMPAAFFTGDTPKAGGPDVIVQGAPFEALFNGTDPMITATYLTTDTAS